MIDALPSLPASPTAGQLAQLACVLEVLAPKPGNVQPGRDFADMSWQDFVVSASVMRAVLDQPAAGGGTAAQRVGDTVFACVKATQAAVGVNTNLGIALLLAPLCQVPDDQPLEQGIADVLAALNAYDAKMVYQAIRLARPGGLGRVAQADVHAPPPADLIQAMRLAADRDAVARQYVTGFADVFRLADRLAEISSDPAWPRSLDQAIVQVFLEQLAREPDSLIARKLGRDAAARLQAQAAGVLQAGYPRTSASHDRLAELDDDLRDDDNQRNPGTTADLLTAAIWVALRRSDVRLPARWQRSLADLQ